MNNRTNRSKTLSSLVDRSHFPGWLTERGIRGRGVEVGTYRGEYAAHILTHWDGILLTVDPFVPQTEEVYLDGCVNGGGGEPIDMNEVETTARERLKPWIDSGRCDLRRAMSTDVAEYIINFSLEFLYIDGNHSREACQADLQAWWKKLKKGGILGFHDTYNRDDKYQRCGVWDVVWVFAHSIGQQPHLTPCTSSWFVKP